MNLKVLLPLLFAFTCALTTQAQISKGAKLFGSSIGYNHVKLNSSNVMQSDIKTTSFVVSPSAGVAVKENLVVGIRLDYSKSTEKSQHNYGSSGTTENKNYGGGFFLRKYVPLVNRLYVFGESNIMYTVNRQKASQQSSSNSGYEIKSKGWSTGLNFTPGISYGVSKKFQIEGGFNSLLNVSYAKSKTTYENNEVAKMDSFSGGIGSDNGSMFYVGFRVIL